ncbi:MAG: Cytochrome b6 [Phycisphaerae bacterium]|nr:Cytochrome b6 [Phycisphaerae bacterium]
MNPQQQDIPSVGADLEQETTGVPQPDGREEETLTGGLRRLWPNFRQATFRSGRARTGRGRALKVFANLFLHIHSTRTHLYSLRFWTTAGLGIAAAASFVVAAVTGVLLMIYYTPSTALAYQSIKDIHYTVPTGRFIRNLHRWSAHIMVIAALLHAVRVFFTGAYRRPREFNWLIGLALLAVTLGLSFTGYLLPWDQLAYWAATIGSNIAGSPRELTDALGVTQHFDPGGFLRHLLLGADYVGQPALTRFYLLHVMVLPLALVGLMGIHFWRIRKDGGLARPSDAQLRAEGLLPHPGRANPTATVFEPGPKKTYGLMALVRGRTPPVGKGPENTAPSWPRALRAEMAVAMTVLAICMLLSLLADAPLKEIANPQIPENPAKAPWYFLGVQELVSYSAFMGGLLLPGLVVLGLALIPFLDRKTEPAGRWFVPRPHGRRVFVRSLIVGTLLVVGIEALAIRLGWIRGWGRGTAMEPWLANPPQLLIIFVNPATVLAALYAAWSLWIYRRTRSTRLAAIALFTCILAGFVVLTWIGTVNRGPNWHFYWSPGDWPAH